MIRKSINAIYLFFAVVLLCGMFALVAPSAFAQTNVKAGIYFDGSGSMKGYFDSGSIIDINSKLYEVFSTLNLTPTSQVFVTRQNVTRLQAIDAFVANPSWGSQTRLDEAFAMAPSGEDVMALITDNVQDAGESATSSTRNFYDLLESAKVRVALLCPLKTRFSGPIYFYKQQFPDLSKLIDDLRDRNPHGTFKVSYYQSQHYHVLNMKGMRALALYVIVRSGPLLKHLPALIDRLEKTFSIKPILVVRPVDQGKITLQGVTSKVEVQASFKAMSLLCGEYGQASLPLAPPNLQLTPPSSTIFRPITSTDDERYILTPFHYKPLPVDQEMHFGFYAKLVNGSDTIVLGNEDQNCGKEVTVTLKNIKYSLPPQLKKCFLKPQKEAEGFLVPGFIPNVVANSTGMDVGSTFPFVAQIRIRLPSFHLNPTFGSILKLALTSEIPVKIRGTIRISVPPGHFSLTDKYENSYFTHFIYDQSRIYSPEDIVSYINNRPSEIAYDFVSRDLTLLPPAWIQYSLYVFVGLILLVLLFLFMSFSRHYYFKFNDTGETLSVFLLFPFTRRCYLREGVEMLRFSRGLLGYRVAPSARYCLEDSSGKTVPFIGLGSSWSFLVKGSREQPDVIVAQTTAAEHVSSLRQSSLSGISKAKKESAKNETDDKDESSDGDGKKKRTTADKTEVGRLFGSDE